MQLRRGARLRRAGPSGRVGSASSAPGPEARSRSALRSGLPKGSYTATYHVISADSHPVSGGFVFSIGKPGGVPKTVAQLTAQDKVGSHQIGFGIARGVSYAAIAFAIGALVFLIWTGCPACARSPAATRAGRGLGAVLTAAASAAVCCRSSRASSSEACQLVFQGATGAGGSFWGAIDHEDPAGGDPDPLRHHAPARSDRVRSVLPGAGWCHAAGRRCCGPASVGATGLAAPRFGRLELVGDGRAGRVSRAVARARGARRDAEPRVGC